MTHHLHLLMTPTRAGQIAQVMQSLGRRYVRHINDRYHRTGTLWEGRYKACLVQGTTHLLRCYRTIELNPVRAAMVADPRDYRWSSRHANAIGQRDPLDHPHAKYVALRREFSRLETSTLISSRPGNLEHQGTTMPHAVFTTSESSIYDDLIEERYHFPATYLRQVKASVGDWIVYYEPRRTSGAHSATGRQAYFAVARVAAVVPDPHRFNHFYAVMRDYMAFDTPVPFRDPTGYREAKLLRDDGKTNKGAFGRSVREIPHIDFEDIIRRGINVSPEPWERTHRIAEDVPEYITRSVIETITVRTMRDAAFRRQVRTAYANTCAVTGLRLINGGGRPEVQAAHIRSVEADGPDTIRNGIALTGTAHWLFDRGLMTFGDDYSVILSPHGVPNEVDKLIRNDRRLVVPAAPELQPHRTYLHWHRETCFKA